MRRCEQILAFSIIATLCVGVMHAAAASIEKKGPHTPSDSGDALARYRFAPAWMPNPRFKRDPNFPIAAAPYSIIWSEDVQKELRVSPEQKQKLLAINAKAIDEGHRLTEEFKALPPEERRAQAKSWGGKPSPRRQKLEEDVRRGIEAALTPGQLQAAKDIVFPYMAIGLLYDEPVRRQIAMSLQQEDELRRVIKDKLAHAQDENIQHAEKVWNLMTPEQQAKLPDVVRHQGPTSAILALAYEIGFDPGAAGSSHPMLSMRPVRERLKLSAEQQDGLQAVMSATAERTQKRLASEEADRKRGQRPAHSAPEFSDKELLEAILTPEQLTKLKQLDLQRGVVLAMGYPEKRASIGITDAQKAEMDRLEKEKGERQSRLDEEFLPKALKVLTPHQRQQLIAEIDRQGRW